jgi:hypothetical protein
MEEIHSREMTHRLCDGADVGVDPRPSAGQVTHRRRKVRRVGHRTQVHQPGPCESVAHHDGEGNHGDRVDRGIQARQALTQRARLCSSGHLWTTDQPRWPSLRNLLSAPFSCNRKNLDTWWYMKYITATPEQGTRMGVGARVVGLIGALSSTGGRAERTRVRQTLVDPGRFGHGKGNKTVQPRITTNI